MSHEAFTQLYTEHERALYGFVLSLLPDKNAADDVMQTALTQLWEHFDDFDHDRPFFPWACRFAYRQVLMYRRRYATQKRFFSEATIELLADDAPTDESWEEARTEALQSCLGKLTERQRSLIHHRYRGEKPIKYLADELGQSVNALYKSLERTRKVLADCVQNALNIEGTT